MFVYIPLDIGKKPHSLQTSEDEVERMVIKIRANGTADLLENSVSITVKKRS